jgi:hypothetical protein
VRAGKLQLLLEDIGEPEAVNQAEQLLSEPDCVKVDRQESLTIMRISDLASVLNVSLPGARRRVPVRFCRWFLTVCKFLPRLLRIAVTLAVLVPPRSSPAADGIEELLRKTHWGESSGDLLHEFGDQARRLPRALDFGDSYAEVVLTSQNLGGVPVVVFFQMDKTTRGLKRIQLERPRHGANPPSFRAIAAALHAEYGRPDQTCVIPVLPASGYQAAAEERWARGGTVISAIFRDTTLQAFEGCLFGPATGWCGLHGQLLVRIGPPDGGADPCSLASH